MPHDAHHRVICQSIVVVSHQAHPNRFHAFRSFRAAREFLTSMKKARHTWQHTWRARHPLGTLATFGKGGSFRQRSASINLLNDTGESAIETSTSHYITSLGFDPQTQLAGSPSLNLARVCRVSLLMEATLWSEYEQFCGEFVQFTCQIDEPIFQLNNEIRKKFLGMGEGLSATCLCLDVWAEPQLGIHVLSLWALWP